MANIELLISRYLDGELTPAENAYLRRLLAESSEARATLREMTEVARAARRIPRMHAPEGGLEARLFQRLSAEGLHKGPAPKPAPVEAPAAPFSFLGMRRGSMAVAGLLLLVLTIGGAYLRFGGEDAPARAPIALGFSGAETPAPGALIGGSESALVADHGGMVNIPEVSLRLSASRRPNRVPSRARAAAVENVREDRVEPMQALANDTSLRLIAPSALADHTTPSVDTTAPAMPSKAAHIAPSILPQQPVAGVRNHWAASFRGGVATVNDDAGTQVRELDMKVGLQMVGGHKVSFIVGVAPAISETRRENTGIGLSSPALSQVPPSTDELKSQRAFSEQFPEFERVVRSEPWFGVGYNYSLPLVKDLSIDPGVKAGASASTWRVGAELPVSYRMSKYMSIECAVAIAHVLPREASSDNRALTDTPYHFIYEETKQVASFTTYGVQLGIRLEIPAGK